MRELALALLIGLASYRAWALIALDEITRPAREWLFAEVRGERRLIKWLKLWLMCPWCAGTWVTAAVALVTDLIVDGGVPMPVLVFVGAAAVTALLGGNDDRLMDASA